MIYILLGNRPFKDIFKKNVEKTYLKKYNFCDNINLYK